MTFWGQYWKPISHCGQQKTLSGFCQRWTNSQVSAWYFTDIQVFSPEHSGLCNSLRDEPALNRSIRPGHSREATRTPAFEPWSGKNRPEVSKTQASFFSNITQTFTSQREWIQLRTTASKKTSVFWNLPGDLQHATQIGVVTSNFQDISP